MISSVGLVIIWIAVAIVALIILLWFFPVTLWFQALISGVRISLIQLVLMRWRKVPPSTIVMAMVTGTKAGLKLDATWTSRWRLPSTSPAAMCSRPCRCL